jgi:acylphosphatase
MKHLNIKVIGRVQGVFFRVNTRDKACELGLNGFVRNEPDGSVYIEIEGKQKLLDEFLSWLKQSPKLSNVDALQITKADVEGFKKFEIR